MIGWAQLLNVHVGFVEIYNHLSTMEVLYNIMFAQSNNETNFHLNIKTKEK